MEKKMTTELWDLYRFIEKNTLEGKSLTIEEIAQQFPNRYSFNNSKGNHSNCSTLYEDIFQINTTYSSEHDKYIVTNRNKIKLGTYVDILKEKHQIAKQFSRYSKKLKVLKRILENDGQYKLLSNQNKPIDENSSAKPYVESFIKDVNTK